MSINKSPMSSLSFVIDCKATAKDVKAILQQTADGVDDLKRSLSVHLR